MVEENESQKRASMRIKRDLKEQSQDDSLVIDSTLLLADRKEVFIRHAGEVYRLRLTRNGKLILNK